MIGDIGKATAPSGVGGITDMQPRMPTEQRERDIGGKMRVEREKLAKADADIQQAQMDVEASIIGSKAKSREEQAASIREKVDETKRKQTEFSDPEFHPTEENAQSLAQLFSLVATSGLLLGSSGKMSAMNSLAAMNGMMEGWRSGRQDLYKREVDKFNKEIERRRRIREDLRQDLQDFIKLSSIDREAADLKQEEIIRKSGTSSIIGQYMLKSQAENALKTLEADLKIEQDIANRQQKAREEERKIAAEKRKMEHEKFLENLRLRQVQAAERRAAAAAAGGGKVSDRYGFGDIVATASNEAAASLQNLVQMPSDVTSGIFGGRRTTSLFTAPLDTLVNTAVTSEDTQRYNTEINNLGKFIAQVQKGGRVVTNADIETTAQAFRIEEGDKPLTKLTKLAQARQALERALEVRIASPNTPEQLKQVYRQNQEDIRIAVPFTVSDVNKFANERDKNTTFTESFSGFGKGKQAPSAGPKEGDRAPSKSGKPMVFRNGNWEYE